MWNFFLLQKCHLFLFINLQIHNMAILLPGRPSRRVARNGFVNNKQMAFYKIKFHNNYCFFIFKTSGYNVECEWLCSQSNKYLPHICWFFKVECNKKPNFWYTRTRPNPSLVWRTILKKSIEKKVLLHLQTEFIWIGGFHHTCWRFQDFFIIWARMNSGLF